MTEKAFDVGAASRRAFLGRALAALAAGPVMLSGAGRALAGGRALGTVTLDALLLTYYPAPVGPAGAATWQLDTAADFTLRLLAGDLVALDAGVPQRARELFLGVKFEQSASRKVRDALVLRHALRRGEEATLTTEEGGGPEATAFFGLLRPRLRLHATDRPAAEPRPKFWLEDSGPAFFYSLGALRGHEDLRDQLGAGTAESWDAVYAHQGELAGPRYVLRDRVVGRQTVSLEERGEEVGNVATATTSARVVAVEPADGASSLPLEVGSAISVVHSSAQRPTVKRVARVEAEVEGSTGVYYDRVFKTFVFAQNDPSGSR
jgi:hypothetical protein